MIVVTAGHVDHGKTTLIRALTGTDTDRLAEEKTRGMSINLGFAYHHFLTTTATGETRQHTISFVDVPGHTDFASNMLAGAWSADLAMIVVTADDGIMPQTREHVLTLDLLGVDRAIIVINATDRASAERTAEVAAHMVALLATTTLRNAPVFAVSARNAEGVPALLQHLERLATTTGRSAEDCGGYFRFAVDRSFVLKGIGTVVTGTVRSGIVNRDDQLLHSGSGELLRVRGLHLNEQPLESATCGQRVAVAVTLHHDLLRRGDWLMNPILHHPTHQFDALVHFASPAPNTMLHLHLSAAHHMVTLRVLGHCGKDARSQWCQIRCREPITAHWGDRFILRDAAAQSTIAGGVVMDIFAPRRKPDSLTRITTLSALNNCHEDALRELLAISHRGVSLDEFAINRNVGPWQIQSLQLALQARGVRFVALTSRSTNNACAMLPTLLGMHFYQRYRDEVIDALAVLHKERPTLLGLDAAALLAAVNFCGSTPLFSAILRTLLEHNEIVRTGTLLHLPDHRAIQSDEEQRFMARLQPLLMNAGYVAPRVFELMEMLNLEQATVEKMLKLNCQAGKLLQVSRNRYYLPETIMQIAALTERLADENCEAGFSVIQFRDRSGIGRNLCIEILEYFDAQGLTRRLNNARVLRNAKGSIFSAREPLNNSDIIAPSIRGGGHLRTQSRIKKLL